MFILCISSFLILHFHIFTGSSTQCTSVHCGWKAQCVNSSCVCKLSGFHLHSNKRDCENCRFFVGFLFNLFFIIEYLSSGAARYKLDFPILMFSFYILFNSMYTYFCGFLCIFCKPVSIVLNGS